SPPLECCRPALSWVSLTGSPPFKVASLHYSRLVNPNAVSGNCRSPALDLFAEKLGLLAGRDGEHAAAVLLDARAEVGIAQDVRHGSSEKRNDGLGRRRRRKHGEPALALEANPALAQPRHVLELARACGGTDRIGLQPAGLHVVLYRRQVVHHQVDAAREHLLV